MQNLLYGIAATSLNESEVKSFSFAFNSMFAKIFSKYDIKIIAYCQFYSAYLTFKLLYDLHRYLFLAKQLSLKRMNSRLEIDQYDYRDYIRLQVKYNLTVTDSSREVKRKIWNVFENTVQTVMT